jgi:hypothetical protein
MAFSDRTARRHDGDTRAAISDGVVALLKAHYGVGPGQATPERGRVRRGCRGPAWAAGVDPDARGGHTQAATARRFDQAAAWASAEGLSRLTIAGAS